MVDHWLRTQLNHLSNKLANHQHNSRIVSVSAFVLFHDFVFFSSFTCIKFVQRAQISYRTLARRKEVDDFRRKQLARVLMHKMESTAIALKVLLSQKKMQVKQNLNGIRSNRGKISEREKKTLSLTMRGHITLRSLYTQQ